MNKQVLLHVMATFLAFLCFTFNMIGLFGTSWIVVDESSKGFRDLQKYFGIIRTCQMIKEETRCYYRKGLLQYHYLTQRKAIILDVVFLTVLVSTCCCFIVVQCSFIIFKCQKSKKFQRVCIIINTTLSFCSVLLEISSVSYLQIRISSLPSAFSQGWTAHLTWVTVCLQITFTAVCLILISKETRTNSKRGRAESPSSTLNYPLERYFYGSSKSNSMSRFNERWFDERYSTTATKGYVVTGYTNSGYQLEKMRTEIFSY